MLYSGFFITEFTPGVKNAAVHTECVFVACSHQSEIPPGKMVSGTNPFTSDEKWQFVFNTFQWQFVHSIRNKFMSTPGWYRHQTRTLLSKGITQAKFFHQSVTAVNGLVWKVLSFCEIFSETKICILERIGQEKFAPMWTKRHIFNFSGSWGKLHSRRRSWITLCNFSQRKELDINQVLSLQPQEREGE